MTPIFIANWKMNFMLDEALDFIKHLDLWRNKVDKTIANNVIIAPPLPYISQLASLYPEINFASQYIDAHKDFGPYTGEVSAKMIKSVGANYAIVGHSDKRAYIHETNQRIQTKAKNCLDANVTPIICVGESLETRKNKTHLQFISQQLIESFPQCSNDTQTQIIVVYEPIWAIGTGITPTKQEISEAIIAIKEILDASVVAKNIRLVYGGSVNSGNCHEILCINGVSGVLMGSASLNLMEFIKIITDNKYLIR